MKWKKIPKGTSRQPSEGKYSDWKQQIANEGFNQCVYCAIHESSFGGIRNFHVEHYKPKSKFSDLENDIMNLFYSCAICNTFKSDDWPDEPCKSFSNASYPYPGDVDYSDIFTIISSSGMVRGKYVASKYMTLKLFLNRPQLIMERRMQNALSHFDDLTSFFLSALPELKKLSNDKANSYMANYATSITETVSLKRKLEQSVPYTTSDVKRKTKSKKSKKPR